METFTGSPPLLCTEPQFNCVLKRCNYKLGVNRSPNLAQVLQAYLPYTSLCGNILLFSGLYMIKSSHGSFQHILVNKQISAKQSQDSFLHIYVIKEKNKYYYSCRPFKFVMLLKQLPSGRWKHFILHNTYMCNVHVI